MNRFLLLSLVLALVVSSCNDGRMEEVSQENIVALEHFWEIPVPNQIPPEGLGSMSSHVCGACHQEHYREWRMSTHSHAWTDPQFQAELEKESSPWFCINCHVPLQNQQEYIVTGKIDGDIYKPVRELNPLFDYDLQQEGINCASCHVRDGAIVGPTGSDKAPHKTVKDTEHLSEQLCIQCHNATAVITPTLACTFETADEWEAGPYSKEGKNCKTCHMPDTMREAAPGYGVKLGHFHGFPGSGIRKYADKPTNMLNALDIFPSEVKKQYNSTDTAHFSMKLINQHAGHRFPTGDPERFIMIDFIIQSENGDTLGIESHRIGEKWEWYPEAKKLEDNNMEPLEERDYSYPFQSEYKGKVQLTMRVSKHRATPETNDYHNTPDYPLHVVVFEEEFNFELR